MEGASICMDDTKLDAPLPLIGLYITGACAICMVAMGIDTIRGFVEKRHWFPCKFFSINATTLALLSVACKLPMDLSARMPAPEDQLTKLSGTVFICVSMCFFMPSLGVMTKEQIVANMVALFLFVITVVVDVCTQLATGLIYKFRAENVVVLVCMLLLLGLLCSSAVAKDAVIKILEKQYEDKEDKEQRRKPWEVDMEYVKQDIRTAWLMAHSSNPQYVLARSLLSTATGALSWVCVLLLLQAEIRSFFMDFCTGQSSYLWANWPVLISQTLLAVLVGSVAPTLRWLNVARMVSQDSDRRKWRVNYGVESFWVKELEDWKKNPVCSYFRNSRSEKTFHVLRNMMLDICIMLQKAFVQLSNVICLTCAWFLMLYNKLTSMLCNLDSSDVPENDGYVLCLAGENDKWISNNVGNNMEHWMEKGKKEKCGSLLKLLRKSPESEGFKNMCLFSHSNVSPIPNSSCDAPPNCWTLPAVTLIAIAVSLSRFKRDRIKMMVDGLSEGLEMMKFVEKHLDDKGLASVRKETEILWSTIKIYGKWSDCDLQKLPTEDYDLHKLSIDKNRKWLDLPALKQHKPTLILGCLAIIGKKQVMDYAEELDSETSKPWPPTAVLGNSLYRMSMTILNDFSMTSLDDLLDLIEKTLADIVGKCLSMLPNAIFFEYMGAGPTNRETRLRNAVRFLGKADHLFESLHCSQPQDQVKPRNIEFTCQEKPECTCQKFPGFPCPYGTPTVP